MDEKLPELSTTSTRASAPEMRSARLDSTLICVAMPSGLPLDSIVDREAVAPAGSAAASVVPSIELPGKVASSADGEPPPPHAARATPAEAIDARQQRGTQVRKTMNVSVTPRWAEPSSSTDRSVEQS